MDKIPLSVSEILGLIGAAQCFFLMVALALRAQNWQIAVLPVLYFLILGLSFSAELFLPMLHLGAPVHFYINWILWFSGPPLSLLLILQLSDMSRPASWRDGWVLMLLPLSFLLSNIAGHVSTGCAAGEACKPLQDLLNVTGLMVGAISLLLLLSKKDVLRAVARQKNGQARYWLILSLVILNTCFLLVMLLALTDRMPPGQAALARNILGLGFVYLVSTSLMRLYPQEASRPQTSNVSASDTAASLSAEDKMLALKIENLLTLEKVYQEPTYSRADMARECAVPEAVLSRVINVHFLKSFPQIMNECRINDAKQLLAQTDAPVQQIAGEVGFNSLPSFNRVFKEMTGDSPSGYRASVRLLPRTS